MSPEPQARGRDLERPPNAEVQAQLEDAAGAVFARIVSRHTGLRAVPIRLDSPEIAHLRPASLQELGRRSVDYPEQ